MAVRTMQSYWLLGLMLLLHQQQLLGGQQLVRPPDEGPSSPVLATLLSDNLNASLVPAETIKTVERRATATATAAATADEVAEMLQVTPANQLPLSPPDTPAAAAESFTMATGDLVERIASAATLDAITAAEEESASMATEAAGVREESEHMRIPPPTAAQIAKINVSSATMGDRVGIEPEPVIPDKINMARTAAIPQTVATAIMPAKTKRTQAANKSVVTAGIELNSEPEQSPGYVNATEAWPALTTTNVVMEMEMEQQGSTVYPPITGTSSSSSTSKSKTVPTPRLLGGGASVAHILAKSLENPQAPSSAGWPVKHAAVLEGDVILGGLMMVHSREDSITCGPIMPQGGIQALEAMLYTLDQVNKQQLLPNVTLGAHLLDDCDKDTYGLEMAVDFIKGK